MTRCARSLHWTSHRYYKWLQTQQQTQIPQSKNNSHLHIMKVSKCPQSALSASNKLSTNLTLPRSLGSSRWAILNQHKFYNLHKFYHVHKLKAMCHSIKTNSVVIVDTYLLVSDVNFAFKDVSRIPCLVLAMSNIVWAHTTDCGILPGKLAEVHMYYKYRSIRM